MSVVDPLAPKSEAEASSNSVPRYLDRRELLAGTGLAIIGAGLSIAMDAGSRRQRRSGGKFWMLQGTLGLSLVGAGLSVFGEAVALRALEILDKKAESF